MKGFIFDKEQILFHPDILNEIHVGILICDRNGKLLFINRFAANIFDTAPNDWIGHHMTSIIPDSVIYKALTTKTPQIGKHSKWKKKNFIVDASPIIVKNTVIGAISTLKDDQELQRLTDAYEDLKRYVNMLEIKLEYSTQLPYTFSDFIVAPDSPMCKIIFKILKAASTDIPILIRGESGVGKELIAIAIHESSLKAEGPFITVNCAAIPESLMESELFGYEEGAFTGAKKNGKKGKFELAKGGSIFLDEIGDMNYNLQAKLLRVLQQKEMVRVGGNDAIPLDVRIITATHQNLELMIKEGKFREDLYYRINGTSFEIPPLRARKMDIKAIVQQTLVELNNHYGKRLTLSDEAETLLINHPLQGNVRELKHALEHAVIMCEYEEIKTSDLPITFIDKVNDFGKQLSTVPIKYRVDPSDHHEESNTLNLNYHVGKIEKKLIIEALERSGYNRSKAIKILGISRQTFYDRLKQYEINL
ncbi:sigma-54-dependent Fis family transcriptional regulator [Peribacillus cavernae]|uniref:Sigma-54-dependent Fis family transcriptional regulator n=1 Tax=Peribacillus cavernae TaxID=1674310 RepID=A0A3S0VMF4_9BACI|nr:sigma 54-interacting transcriptional regulator [Peribacillus cavernae]MDQ0218744.1 transcriptional regulator with PAS, ATPase and Fis domain [Peribacillus cavernae]RUQ30957.1 sigma-54-dependent Fis family transcriptional regulator [Peribacillus cavernae]